MLVPKEAAPLSIDQMRTFLEGVATNNNLNPLELDTWHAMSDLDLYQHKVVKNKHKTNSKTKKRDKKERKKKDNVLIMFTSKEESF